ncbi:6-carboxytetrahydropterin synthase QueD [Kroppenstedtia guangzhouensis]|jgi:6-pyruvoyltetrahydropterin/6-carboxytetrahydropterin synthase|uniref:6-carboxy-5,6,7,8-tetrahydropterin synthase n=1 Tax=Kroppenstedtia guangzhouensis TaxID=1274356 RepID=A0ABQ1G367_9BACL|nr:6-carboxytetrahydropterin synthase QueD [Kroppenstedtia guangzhouensis]GGA35716.1 6-carboxytetrahydropterin synthase QueD [Kroppenstedtia guangzhouensis]
MKFSIPDRVQRLGVDIGRHELRYHRKRVAVTREFTFDAAHHLHLYKGKCKSLHGHTYRLVITISGFVDEIGIAVDFGEIKRMYKEEVEARLDHRYLNEVLPNMNTSAENMIVWIWEVLDDRLEQDGWKKRGHRLEELVLYETPTSRATMKREWMEAEDFDE